MNPGWVYYEGYTRDLALRSVGPGWAALVNRVFDGLPAGVKIVQVKEKLGALTIYTEPPNDDVTLLVRDAMADSYNTCENCGALGFHRSGPNTITGRNYIRTLCDTCEQIYQTTGDEPWL